MEVLNSFDAPFYENRGEVMGPLPLVPRCFAFQIPTIIKIDDACPGPSQPTRRPIPWRNPSHLNENHEVRCLSLSFSLSTVRDDHRQRNKRGVSATPTLPQLSSNLQIPNCFSTALPSTLRGPFRHFTQPAIKPLSPFPFPVHPQWKKTKRHENGASQSRRSDPIWSEPSIRRDACDASRPGAKVGPRAFHPTSPTYGETETRLRTRPNSRAPHASVACPAGASPLPYFLPLTDISHSDPRNPSSLFPKP